MRQVTWTLLYCTLIFLIHSVQLPTPIAQSLYFLLKLLTSEAGVDTKKTQVYSHNVLTTWNRLLSDDDTANDAAARSFVVSGCKAGCERPELCYNDGGIYTV